MSPLYKSASRRPFWEQGVSKASYMYQTEDAGYGPVSTGLQAWDAADTGKRLYDGYQAAHVGGGWSGAAGAMNKGMGKVFGLAGAAISPFETYGAVNQMADNSKMYQNAGSKYLGSDAFYQDSARTLAGAAPGAGAAIGAGIGSLAGGVGAIPGAIAGATIGGAISLGTMGVGAVHKGLTGYDGAKDRRAIAALKGDAGGYSSAQGYLMDGIRAYRNRGQDFKTQTWRGTTRDFRKEHVSKESINQEMRENALKKQVS